MGNTLLNMSYSSNIPKSFINSLKIPYPVNRLFIWNIMQHLSLLSPSVFIVYMIILYKTNTMYMSHCKDIILILDSNKNHKVSPEYTYSQNVIIIHL